MWLLTITCILPVELEFSIMTLTSVNAWNTWVLLTYENPEISVTCTHHTNIQPLCSSPPRLGLWILFLSDRSRTEEGRSVHFLAVGRRRRGGEDTGWAARLTGRWGCRWGPRCRDVQGVGGSKDKHQWEYERLDGNLSQEVRLYRCRRNHRREADLVRLCSAASLFRGGQASKPLQTGRYSVIVLPCLTSKASQFESLCADHREERVLIET